MSDEKDPKYEFNAPKFKDFFGEDVVEDEAWFAQRNGDEGGIDMEFVPYYEEVVSKNGFNKATAAISAALNKDFASLPNEGTSNHKQNNKAVEHQKPESDQDVEMEEDHKDDQSTADVQNNSNDADMETSQMKEENQAKTLLKAADIKKERMSHMPTVDQIKKERVSHMPTADQIKKERVSHMPEPIVEQDNDSNTDAESSSKENNVESDHTTNDSNQDIPAKPAPSRKSNIRTSWNSPAVNGGKKERPAMIRRSQPLRSSAKKMNYNETKKRKKTLSQSDELSLTKKTKMEHLSKPETPQFLRKLRDRGIKRGQSTETMQLRQIKELQKQTRAQVKRNDKNMRQAMKAMPYQPVRSFNTTHTKEFHFATDERLKEHTMQTRSDLQKPFETQLRQHPSSPTTNKKGATKPKPFHFLLADKQTVAAPIQKQKWESMALSALNYQTKTPERFRLKPKRDVTSGEKEKKNIKVQVTHPKTPKLMTKARSRPVDIESAEEKEMKEAEAIKNYHFKATELNPKIIEMQGMYGVKQIPEAPSTQVKPFNFEIEQRIQQRKDKEEINKPEPSTHAKSRANTSLPGKEKPRQTEIKPFSFETRDKIRYQKKEEKIKSVLQQEKEAREFHARPLPCSTIQPDALPAVSAKRITQSAPFHISSGSQAYQEKLKNKILSNIEQEKSNRQFKAQTADVVKSKPFKPRTGIIPPTQPDAVVLNSEIRSKERAVFDQWKHENEQELEMLKLQRQRQEEEEEEKRLKQLRREAVPKSNPVRQYKPVEIQKSGKPLTMPMTPNLECKKRASMRL